MIRVKQSPVYGKDIRGQLEYYDPIGEAAIRVAELNDKIFMVEDAARQADPVLWEYVFRAVTEELSWDYLYNALDIPCSRDYYYTLYRRFFWLLDKIRK